MKKAAAEGIPGLWERLEHNPVHVPELHHTEAVDVDIAVAAALLEPGTVAGTEVATWMNRATLHNPSAP
jgi:hypothetical protein